MTLTRSLTLAAALLVLMVAGCARPLDLPGPTLAPQFGTPREDLANAVVNDPQRGYVYVAGVSAASTDRNGGNVYLRRYNQNGTLAWKRLLRIEPYDNGFVPYGFVRGVRLDGAGNVYLAYGQYDDEDSVAQVRKWSPAGDPVYTLGVNDNIHDFEVDAAGNVYLAGSDTNDISTNGRYFLRKYNTQGQRVWERLRVEDDQGGLVETPETIPEPRDLGLASDGSLYVSGYDHLSEAFAVVTKYSNAGTTLWQRPGAGVVTAAGRNFYLLTSANVLQKHNPSGTLLWQKTVTAEPPLTSLAVDANLNPYVAGASQGAPIFARKYTAAGAASWTYRSSQLAASAFPTVGLSARGSTNVYLAGFTFGAVNGRNNGGLDALLLRLNGQGRKVWER